MLSVTWGLYSTLRVILEFLEKKKEQKTPLNPHIILQQGQYEEGSKQEKANGSNKENRI